MTPEPAVQGSHGNLSCPAEEKNKIPGSELSHLWPADSFALQLTLNYVCIRLMEFVTVPGQFKSQAFFSNHEYCCSCGLAA